MNTGNMMTNASSMNVNNQMSGGMQMQGNNPMSGNVPTPNMSAMNTGPMSGNPIGSNTSLASPASAVSSPLPHMGNMNNLGSPLQPGMAMKPGAQTPPANVLQVVKEVQEEAARQGCGSFGKNLPVAGSMPPPPMQRGMNVNMGMQQQNAMMSPQQQVKYRMNGVERKCHTEEFSRGTSLHDIYALSHAYIELEFYKIAKL